MRFLLVHGGWQGGWCWDEVIAALARRGHEAVAPTLPGSRHDAPVERDVGLADFGAFMDRVLCDLDWRDAVVVGHSGGGPVAQSVAARSPDRVRALILVSAWVLEAGECILDHVPPDRASALARTAGESPDRTITMTWERWRGFCRDMPEEEARSYWDRIVPCPLGWLSQPVDLPGSAWRDVPAGYIFLDDEDPLTTTLYRRMAARLSDSVLDHSPGAHQAMLSQPAALADTLLRVAHAARGHSAPAAG